MSKPDRRARAPASVRVCTPSLARSRSTWCSTVRTLSPNAPTISKHIGGPVLSGDRVGARLSLGVTIEATLKADKRFTWKFTEGGQSKSFSGTYTVQGDNLVLTRDEDGQKMDGTVTMNGDKGFKFRLRNTDPNDPGLEFAK